METSTAAEYLIKKLNEQRELIKEHVVSSPQSDHEYCRQCGVAYGLAYAIDLIKQTAENVARNEDYE